MEEDDAKSRPEPQYLQVVVSDRNRGFIHGSLEGLAWGIIESAPYRTNVEMSISELRATYILFLRLIISTAFVELSTG